MKFFQKLYSKPLKYAFDAFITALMLMTGFFVLQFFVFLSDHIIIEDIQHISSDVPLSELLELLLGSIMSIAILAFFIPLPISLIIYNFTSFFIPKNIDNNHKLYFTLDIALIIDGFICTWAWGDLFRNITWTDWDTQLYNAQIHAPINTQYAISVMIIVITALLGFIVLNCFKLEKLPPLVIALSIGGIYLGMFIAVIWSIQTTKNSLMLSVYSANIVLLGLRTIRDLINQWNNLNYEIPENKPVFIQKLYVILKCSSNWHIVGLVSILPLMGIIIIILAVFGQYPDSIIRAWTETADWTFSQKIPPQNIAYDEHYLCTVAAGGHKKIVKPIRIGKRHGHQVIVNRQLCIANAFEQLLEERLPKTHRVIRNFYDKYGYPIAKHIKSPYIADIIWFLMKPLEWFFLITLYLFDVKPENRIAIQYPHSKIPKI